VKTGLDIGSDPAELTKLLAAVRGKTSKPLIVKLTPNTANVALVAAAAEASGADAVSLINTLRAFAADPARPGKAWLGGGTGGQSGPAIRAVALAQTCAVAAAIELPIVAMGGIASAANARQFLDAGALVIAVGTESFRDPAAAGAIRDELLELS
jgi:dihydroorotate dehydrogenase (NAD+) catalytic subunit